MTWARGSRSTTRSPGGPGCRSRSWTPSSPSSRGAGRRASPPTPPSTSPSCPRGPTRRRWARPAQEVGRPDEALSAYRCRVVVDESDRADIHYRLARRLKQLGRPAEARREALKSLEEAPRFLEAHRLLLELVGGDPSRT